MVLRAAVRDEWWKVNEPWEGYVPHFYVDSKGFVSIGVGNLIDPAPLAVALPMILDATGEPASTQEKWDEFQRMKRLAGVLAIKGHRAARKIATMHLTREAVEVLVMAKLDANAVRLSRRWPLFSRWSADAQMAISSWCWAVGPSSPYPRMSAALSAGNFFAASFQVNADENAPPGSSIHLRNTANRLMLRNASRIAELALNPSVLYYPHEIGT